LVLVAAVAGLCNRTSGKHEETVICEIASTNVMNVTPIEKDNNNRETKKQ